MELLKKLKTATIHKEIESKEKLDYLEESSLNKVVNKGLAELYRIQPQNPVTFLANWLLNESRAKEILTKIQNDNKKKEVIAAQIQEQNEYLQKENDQMIQKAKALEDGKTQLKEMITKCDDFESSFNEICEKLKGLTQSTGVYIMTYDLKRKPVESEEDDEEAHIDPSNTKLLRYIHWNEDHEFLHGKALEPGTGVTYSLFQEQTDEEEGQNENAEPPKEEEGEEEIEDKPSDGIVSIMINDVVNDSKIVFFKEPRLGCYYAVNISYKSSLNYKSLLSAIEKQSEYLVKHAEQEKLRQEKEEQIKASGEINQEEKEEEEEAEEAEKNDNDKDNKKDPNAEGGEEGEEEVDEDKSVVLEDFVKEEKVMIIAFDTLGQDRIYSDSEKLYINQMSKLIMESIKNKEKQLLEKDRDLRIEYLGIEKPLTEEWTSDKIQLEQDIAVKDYSISDEFNNKNIVDDNVKKVYFDCAKANWIIHSIASTEFINLLMMFEKFEFVQFEKIFQNVLYFAKVLPQLVNEPETNKLHWKRARSKWSGVFDILKAYDPLGPKPGKIANVFKGNFILENLEPFQQKLEEISEYSYALTRLLDFIVSVLKVRRSDIIVRHSAQKQKIKARNEIIEKNKKIEEERQKAIKDLRNKLKKGAKGGEEEEGEEEEEEEGEKKEENAEEEENAEQEEEEEGEKKKEEAKPKEENKEEEAPFNEDEWLQLYDQEHPKLEVPEEIVVDSDEDFDIGEEDDIEEDEEEEEKGQEQQQEGGD